MNAAFWDRFPKTTKVHCVEMKDQAQEQVARETRGLSSERLFAYFREASRRFRRDMGRAYNRGSL
jgi:hypothetical protein